MLLDQSCKNYQIFRLALVQNSFHLPHQNAISDKKEPDTLSQIGIILSKFHNSFPKLKDAMPLPERTDETNHALIRQAISCSNFIPATMRRKLLDIYTIWIH